MIIIRSQDRLDLMRVNRVEIDSKYVYAVFGEESNVREIGRYKSEERAIEVGYRMLSLQELSLTL